MKIRYLAAFLALSSVFASNAAVITAPPAGSSPISFSALNYFGGGPQSENGITWSSTFSNSAYGYQGAYGLSGNGYWHSSLSPYLGGVSGTPYIGLNVDSGKMTIEFAKPVRAVLGFINYATGQGTPNISIYNANNVLLETYTPTISTPGAKNGGATLGFLRASSDIKYFVLSDAYITLALLNALYGPSAADTLASMQRNVQGLRNIFSLQASYVNPGLSYDCSLFDKNGVCVAFSGRNSVTSDGGPEATSGVLTAAFKVTPNIRVGGFVEQYVSDYSIGGVKVNANNPDFGVFGVWSQTGTDEGLRLRAAYRYGKRDVNITRDAIDSAEAGSGNSKLLTEGAQVTASYGYGLSNTMLASPYVGLRYTNIGRDGYTESASDTVTTPLHFDRLRQESTSLVAGVSLSALVAPSVKVNGSVGVETDIGRNVGKYSASGVADLAAIEFNDDTRRTRMLASVGVTYKIDRTQQIGAQAFYREEAYGSTATTTGMITYAAGF